MCCAMHAKAWHKSSILKDWMDVVWHKSSILKDWMDVVNMEKFMPGYHNA